MRSPLAAGRALIWRLVKTLNRISIVVGLISLLAATTVVAEPLRILSQNMNRLFDDIDDGNNEKVSSRGRFRQRVKRAAKKFGDDFELPHIIAMQEIENRYVLQNIAAEIYRRYGVGYRSVLIPGQDISGINLGYLVRFDFEIKETAQLFRDEIHQQSGYPLFSRPPLLLRTCRGKKCLTLVNLHLRSMRGSVSGKNADRINRKRRLQAETIASWSNQLQTTNAGVSLIILGDLNALTPSDKQVDVAGILRGNPDNTSVRLAGRDLLQPDLVDLSVLIPKSKRYSFVYRQRKQQLDYLLINNAFAADLEQIRFSRIDYQFSDHAGIIAWFKW